MRTRRTGPALPLGLAAVLAALALAAPAQPEAAKTCRQNAINEEPNDSYVPGSPVRSAAGKGHVLSGFVRSTATCRTVVRARLEFFHAGPAGDYSDGVNSWAGRATVFTAANGSYRFESRYPSNSAGVRPHIHFRVSAPGYQTLHRTYFTKPGQRNVRLDVMLDPSR
jgi:protocatechuate 3,4-dioxygenase beta subunit